MLRVVLDTNVILSGLLRLDGTPGRILSAWRGAHFRLVLSEFMLAEIEDVLGRGKIGRALGWSQEKIGRFMVELRAFCEVVEPADVTIEYPRDPDDIPVLGTLIGSGADVLVTGDGDLLALRAVPDPDACRIRATHPAAHQLGHDGPHRPFQLAHALRRQRRSA